MKGLKFCVVLAISWSSRGPISSSAQDAAATDQAAPDAFLTEKNAQKWALLIGVDDYAEIDDNRYCSRDVEALRARLIAGGFPITNVFVLNDDAKVGKYLPSKPNIERQLELIPALTGPEDLIIVAFCGHAVNVGGRSYVCPMEAQPETAEKTLVLLDDVYRQLASAQAKHKLFVVDVGRHAVGTEPNVVEGFLNSLEQRPQGIWVLAGCRAGEVSYEDDELGGGLFWHYLLEGTEGKADQDGGNGDEWISLGELVDYVRSKMSGHAAGGRVQHPMFYGDMAAGLRIAGIPKYAPETEAYPTVQSDPGEASARLEAMVRVNPKSLGAHGRATAAYGHGDLMEAIDYCTDAIRYDPGNTWAYILRASCHTAYGRFAKAVEDYHELGIPLPCFVISKSAQLRLGEEVVAELSQGSKLYVTKAEGEWLWGQFIHGEEAKEGWIHQKDID